MIHRFQQTLDQGKITCRAARDAICAVQFQLPAKRGAHTQHKRHIRQIIRDPLCQIIISPAAQIMRQKKWDRFGGALRSPADGKCQTRCRQRIIANKSLHVRIITRIPA